MFTHQPVNICLNGKTYIPYIPKILLVDDEPRLLESLCVLLAELNFDIDTAATASEAIHKVICKDFDLVILDIGLPDKTGLEVAKAIRGKTYDTKIIIVSGKHDIDTPIEAIKLGVNDYIRKPYSAKTIKKSISGLLSQQHLDRELKSSQGMIEAVYKPCRHILENSPDIAFVADNNGVFTFVNHRVEFVLGYSPGELYGQHYSSIIATHSSDAATFVFGERRTGERTSRNINITFVRSKDVLKNAETQ